MSPKLNTVFEWCNDLEAMRHFYTDLLGMRETHVREDVVVYRAGQIQIVITRSPEPRPILDTWTWTWGFGDGNLREPAWVVEVPWEGFHETVERLRSAGVPMYAEPRDTRELRQVVVRDPMGRTVSVDAYR